MQILGFSELSCTRLYPKYLEFRNNVFNQLLKYHHTGNPVYQFLAFDEARGFETPYGVEFDRYDIPKTLHVAVVGGRMAKSARQGLGEQILGCLRFLPTDGPYMIKDAIESGIWKNVELFDGELPQTASIYEASRIAVLPDVKDDVLRKSIVDSLVFANVEIGVQLGVSRMIGIMYDRVWNSVYRNRGVPVRYLSKPFHVDDGQPIIIGEIDTSPEVLAGLEARYASEIASGHIVSCSIDPATWLTHYYHVNQSIPTMPVVQPLEAVGG
jgi:N-acyl-L-homoserine lactone synthetase